MKRLILVAITSVALSGLIALRIFAIQLDTNIEINCDEYEITNNYIDR
jgi:hypothetical protein